ncbi:MAG: 4Fe-4S dicluster domain-containing protein [Deltaproteobacteria bacterium]|nr:4Fe-4S dicluster domain-containing protein [Deltaproteobacteria bacterium]
MKLLDRREFISKIGGSFFLAIGINFISLFLNFGSMYRYKPITVQSKKVVELQRGGGEEFFLRPPGAKDDKDFLSKCIKCQACVEACPIQAIKIAGREKGKNADTPYIIPEIKGCNLCLDRDKMYCNYVCPTDALEKIPNDKEIIFEKMKGGQPLNMGIPILDRRICYPWYGSNACGLCWEICPYTYKGAVVAGDRRAVHPANAPNFFADKCVGCGLCVDICPLPQKERAVKLVDGRDMEALKKYEGITDEGQTYRWAFDERQIKSRPRTDERPPSDEEIFGKPQGGVLLK